MPFNELIKMNTEADIIAYKNFVLVFDESYHGLHIIHFDKKVCY